MERRLFSRLGSEEHRVFRDMVHRYVAEEVVPHYEAWQRAGQVPRSAWTRAAEHGLLCPSAPPELGGAGADFLYSVAIIEELAEQAVGGFFLALHNDVVFPYLASLGTEEQKRRWIPGCIRGDHVLALAMTEPGAGSDLARIATRAVREGDHYVVDGAKTFISNGQTADLFVVALRTASDPARPHAGLSLLVIEADRPGFVRGKNLRKIGLHAQDTSELSFSGCRVPAGNLLGAEGDGFTSMMRNLQQERLVIAIGSAAAARGCLALTVAYAKERALFGQRLMDLQNTRFELAKMATSVQTVQALVDDLVLRHVAGDEVVSEVSMAKYAATEVQFDVADRCLQLFGGYGYMEEYPVSRHFVDARVQRIYGGANEVMLELIARRLDQ
ncbi:MAG TPA: acyl-CoA dehydrogenase family protein [Candidatus Polarisedimenticolaceae bacterium]|nr:acyl-CoA dehydrogenase family protein [Candidatus Polarisedimenticolaceae bacterium]